MSPKPWMKISVMLVKAACKFIIALRCRLSVQRLIHILISFISWEKWQESFKTDENKKIKMFVAKFRDEIETLRSKTLQEIHSIARDMFVTPGSLSSSFILLTRRRAEENSIHLQRIKEVYQGSKEDIKPRATQRSAIANREAHALHKTATEIAQICRSTVACHQDADKLTRGRQLLLPREDWAEDAKNTGELIYHGRQYAEGITRCLIEPNADTSVVLGVRPEQLSETGRMVVNLFQNGRQTLEKGSGWATTAQTQLKLCNALAKTTDR